MSPTFETSQFVVSQNSLSENINRAFGVDLCLPQMSNLEFIKLLKQQTTQFENKATNMPAKSTIKMQLHKTELCTAFQETGECGYGHKCHFAHGEQELKPIHRHPKYKTEKCKNFETGTCPFGRRCRFAHHDSELRIIENKNCKA